MRQNTRDALGTFLCVRLFFSRAHNTALVRVKNRTCCGTHRSAPFVCGIILPVIAAISLSHAVTLPECLCVCKSDEASKVRLHFQFCNFIHLYLWG